MAELREGTEQLRSLARRYGGQADIVDAVANRSMRLLSVPADDAVQRSLRSALSELHEFAGWCCFDARAYEVAGMHFTGAVKLARDANDPYAVAYALYHAGCMTEERSWLLRGTRGSHHTRTIGAVWNGLPRWSNGTWGGSTSLSGSPRRRCVTGQQRATVVTLPCPQSPSPSCM